ncbi:asparagine synthase-related protein [Actinorugispora endophytica]|uniref:asparagine synthase-related protein n=1 Tax=Actinorugispora endophytica TaxID=1605990 RepID=UPI001FB7DDFA|nr:asparagine synthase-related protein [Actinorugispora endophytica]
MLPSGSAPGLAADHFPSAGRLADHPSGDPWIVGSLPADQFTAVAVGERRLAVIGRCPVGADGLRAELAGLDDVSGLDRIARTLPGSFHLAAVVGGRTRVQGSASGTRRVFHARVGPATVAADRSDVLGGALGTDPDPAVLALRMLDALPHPLGEKSVWPGVEPVPADHYLELGERGGSPRLVRWWHPPEPELGLAEGARALLDALTDAVDARTRDGLVVSADLSGGLDSTPLCALAASGPARVVALTMASGLATDDDLHWARIALRALPSLEHVVYPARELPGFYAGLYDVPARMDEPSAAFMSTARTLARLRLAGGHGSRLHMDGLGGDQLLIGEPALYHDMLRERPLDALRRVRVHQLLGRLPAGRTLASLADGRSHRDWFAAARRGLATGEPVRRSMFGWERPVSFGPWFTAEARRSVLDQFDEALESLDSLAPTRGRHADLAAIRAGAREVRLIHQAAEPGGPVGESPFFDDRVVEACLRVRPEERMTPFEFKPLMKAAMAGILPAEFLRRRTKTDGAPLAAEGFGDQDRRISRVWRDSRLAGLGVLDPESIWEAASRPPSVDNRDWGVDTTLAVELWLRSRDRTGNGTGDGKGSD